MASFKAFLKKEWLEGLRAYRFLVITLGIGFFALLDPVMMKLLPSILQNQFGNIDLSAMMDISLSGVMASHLKNLYQISTFVIVLTLMGIVSSEKGEKTLLLPVAMGLKTTAVILAKWLIYVGFITIVTVCGISLCYGYGALLFDESFESFATVLKAGLLQSLYFAYVLSLVMALSTFSKKTFIAGITSLVAVFTLPLLGMILPDLGKFLPNQLLKEAGLFSQTLSGDVLVAIFSTVILCFMLVLVSILKLKGDELG